MKKTLKMFDSPKYEVFGENDVYVVKDKEKHKFYAISPKEVDELNIELSEREEKVSIIGFYIFLLFIFFLELFNIYIALYDTKLYGDITRSTFISSLALYLLVFIVFHELGHIVYFKYFGKKIDSIGFKFNYIFPSVFVRMNDTYLLSKKEKIIVHLGGLLFSLVMNNLIFGLGIIFNSGILIFLAKYMSIDIVMNSIPMMNSDGYKVILAIKGVVEKKIFVENNDFIKRIKIINILFVIVYTFWFIWNL